MVFCSARSLHGDRASVVGPLLEEKMQWNWPGRLVSILGGLDQLRGSLFWIPARWGNVNLDPSALVLDSLRLDRERCTPVKAHPGPGLATATDAACMSFAWGLIGCPEEPSLCRTSQPGSPNSQSQAHHMQTVLIGYLFVQKQDKWKG